MHMCVCTHTCTHANLVMMVEVWEAYSWLRPNSKSMTKLKLESSLQIPWGVFFTLLHHILFQPSASYSPVASLYDIAGTCFCSKVSISKQESKTALGGSPTPGKAKGRWVLGSLPQKAIGYVHSMAGWLLAWVAQPHWFPGIGFFYVPPTQAVGHSERSPASLVGAAVDKPCKSRKWSSALLSLPLTCLLHMFE